MSLLTVIAVTPFKAYISLMTAALTLAVSMRAQREARLLSAGLSFSAFMLIYVCVDAGHFQDYSSYLNWLRTAEVRLYDHIDKGFGVLMVALGALTTAPWLWLAFVPLAVGVLNAKSAQLVHADLATFFLLILTNPRVHEFVFNSTRAALSISVVVLAHVLWVSGRRTMAIVVSILAFSLHMVIGGVCLFLLVGAAVLPIWMVGVIYVIGGVFLVLGIYPEFLYAWPRQQLTEFVLFTKGDAVDEYLFESIDGVPWVRFSLWVYCCSLTACGLFFYRSMDEIGRRLMRSALMANGVGLLFMSLVPIIARVHLLAVLLGGLALARSALSREGRLDLFMLVLLVMGSFSVFKNTHFISFF